MDKVFSNDDSDIKQTNFGLSDFLTISVIGKGSYAKVLLVKKIGTEKYYAMKVIKKSKVKTESQKKHIQIEKKILTKLKSHPFLVRAFCCFQTQDKLFFVLEYCPGGELFYLLAKKRRFSEEQARFYIAQIILALEHLHENNVIYRDLKPENILIKKDGYIKLADFGLAKQENEQEFNNIIAGTPEYLPPEVIEKKLQTKLIDWWTLGCMLYELLVGYPPFNSSNRNQLFFKIKNQQIQFPHFLSSEAQNLIFQLLQKDPTMRLGRDGAKQIKSHQWFKKKINWNFLLQKRYEPYFMPKIDKDHGLSNFDPEFTEITINSLDINQQQTSMHFDEFSWFGNEQNFSQIIQQQKMNLTSLQRVYLGEYKKVNDPLDNQTLMKFKMDFQNKQQSQHYVQSIKQRQKLKHQNLVHLKYVEIEQIQNWCTSYQQITTQYEYFQNNLKKETLKLKRNNDKFTSIQMLRMIYDCIDVLALFEENKIQINEINPLLLFLYNDDIDDLFRIKFCERISGSQNSQINKLNSLSSNLNLYLSPEDFEQLSQGKNNQLYNNVKPEVFAIGLCFLEAGIQDNIQDIYNLIQGKFKQENLYNHIRKFDKLYEDLPMLQSLLQKLLQINQDQRPTFIELKHALPEWYEIKKVLQSNQYIQNQVQEYDNVQVQYDKPSYIPQIQNFTSQQVTQFDPQSQKFIVSNQDNIIEQKNPIQIFDNTIQNKDQIQNQGQDMFLHNQNNQVFSDTHQYDSNNQFQNFDIHQYKSGYTNKTDAKENDTSVDQIQDKIKTNYNQISSPQQYDTQRQPKDIFKHITFQQQSSQNSNRFKNKNQKFDTNNFQQNDIDQIKEKVHINSQPILVNSQEFKIKQDPEIDIKQNYNKPFAQTTQNFEVPQYQDIKVNATNQTLEQNQLKNNQVVQSHSSLLSKEKQVNDRPHLRYYEKFFHRVPKLKISSNLNQQKENFLQQQKFLKQQKLDQIEQSKKKQLMQQEIKQPQVVEYQKQNYVPPLIQNNEQKIDIPQYQQMYNIQQQNNEQIQNSSTKKPIVQLQDFNIFNKEKKKLSRQNTITKDIQPQIKKCSKRDLQDQDNYFTRQKQYTDIVVQQSNFFSDENSIVGFKTQEVNNNINQIQDKQYQQNDYFGYSVNNDYFTQNSEPFQQQNQQQTQKNQQQEGLINYQQGQYFSLFQKPQNQNNQQNIQDQQNIQNPSENQQKFQNIYDLLEQNETNFGVLPQQNNIQPNQEQQTQEMIQRLKFRRLKSLYKYYQIKQQRSQQYIS